MLKKGLKIVLWSLVGLVVGLLVVSVTVGIVLYRSVDLRTPDVVINTAAYRVVEVGDSLRTVGRNSLLKNRYGLWEARIAGSAIERGTVLGRLTAPEIAFQEQVFIDQIRRIIPSDRYLWLLHKLTFIFNRHMADHIPQEYREEIYALSASCSHDFDVIGSPYARQLNYHAAHDIGHAMQEYMLVGCTSFALWGSESADGALLVGRNFDFWVGDDFARNKIVLFVEPDAGYRFVSVTWPGMVGVLSGMNERGLTVTINASKGAIPTASALPISLLARHILQYAATIEEAYAIAAKAQTFVSESLLIATAEDGRAAIIEKSPDQQNLHAPMVEERVISTNHYQSIPFLYDPINRENIATTDSPHRWARVAELLDRTQGHTPTSAAAILRDRRGVGDCEIGLTNELAINQCIAHHGVIFQPAKRRMWLSTDPWQAGQMLCYDLDKVFARKEAADSSFACEELMIEADTAFLRHEYPRAVTHRALSTAIRAQLDREQPVERVLVDSLIRNNPHYYGVYDLAADVAHAQGDLRRADSLWREALRCAIPRLGERQTIEQKLPRYGTR